MKITVKAKVTDDSKNKLGKIESEFQNYQIYLQSGCTAIANLYSATKQQAQRALKKIKQLNPKKQYPVRGGKTYAKLVVKEKEGAKDLVAALKASLQKTKK